jgi:cytoskeletal protein CcmA (bactofilin family)
MWPFRSRPDEKSLAVFIGAGSEFDGRCRFTGTTIVDGRITGDLLAAEHLIIGESGMVASVVNATVVIVKGTLTGNVAATQRVELSGTARVTGDIETPALTMEAGATVNGHCRISPAQREPSVGVIVPLAR